MANDKKDSTKVIAPEFTSIPLHKRKDKDTAELQDHDITRLLPKSSATVAVLATMNRLSIDGWEAEAIMVALKNEQIKNIVMISGPGHWRGMYLTKTPGKSRPYELELFDPQGASGNRTIHKFAETLMKTSGIPLEQINITYTAPRKLQTDQYSCGDFVCAYSHKKIQEFGVANGFDSHLIEVLNNSGNENNALRKASQEATEKLMAPLPVSIVPADNVDSEDELGFTHEQAIPEYAVTNQNTNKSVAQTFDNINFNEDITSEDEAEDDFDDNITSVSNDKALEDIKAEASIPPPPLDEALMDLPPPPPHPSKGIEGSSLVQAQEPADLNAEANDQAIAEPVAVKDPEKAPQIPPTPQKAIQNDASLNKNSANAIANFRNQLGSLRNSNNLPPNLAPMKSMSNTATTIAHMSAMKPHEPSSLNPIKATMSASIEIILVQRRSSADSDWKKIVEVYNDTCPNGENRRSSALAFATQKEAEKFFEKSELGDSIGQLMSTATDPNKPVTKRDDKGIEHDCYIVRSAGKCYPGTADEIVAKLKHDSEQPGVKAEDKEKMEATVWEVINIKADEVARKRKDASEVSVVPVTMSADPTHNIEPLKPM
ncbi:MAG: hypothetical protein ACHP65_08265 [Legionellales bacterium]